MAAEEFDKEQARRKLKTKVLSRKLKKTLKNTGFHLEDIINITFSNHSDLARVILSRNGEKIEAAAKRHHEVQRYSGPFSALVRSPSEMYGRETRNLCLIAEKVDPQMVPGLYVQNGIYNLAVWSYVGGESYWQKLVQIGKKLDQNPEDSSLQKERCQILYNLVEQVARFVGSCNANRLKLKNEYPGYTTDSEKIISANKEVFRENIYKLAKARDNKELQESLDFYLERLWDLGDCFNVRKIFVH